LVHAAKVYTCIVANSLCWVAFVGNFRIPHRIVTQRHRVHVLHLHAGNQLEKPNYSTHPALYPVKRALTRTCLPVSAINHSILLSKRPVKSLFVEDLSRATTSRQNRGQKCVVCASKYRLKLPYPISKRRFGRFWPSGAKSMEQAQLLALLYTPGNTTVPVLSVNFTYNTPIPEESALVSICAAAELNCRESGFLRSPDSCGAALCRISYITCLVPTRQVRRRISAS
jgi:hypothetical protein